MQRHRLEPVGGQPISEVVRRLGAVLASDERQSEIAIGTRCSAYETGDLAQALAAGTIIKVFAFRGAMHYVSPQDGGAYPRTRNATDQESGRPTVLRNLTHRLPPSDPSRVVSYSDPHPVRALISGTTSSVRGPVVG